MNRFSLQKLLTWKQSKRRKPLVLRGARQVGKTHLLKQFGEKEYAELAYFNFEEDRGLDELFATVLTPKVLIEKLGIYRGKKIFPETTLIFLDEIQEARHALNSLKYFAEDANDYHIVSAGSLLGIQLSKYQSFPVGKVNLMSLYPLCFSEFLLATGRESLFQLLEEIKSLEPLSSSFHQQLLDLIRIYLFVGGMPEAVHSYVTEGDFSVVREIQREILDTYLLDFSKHASPSDVLKITHLWQAVPSQLAKENKKFVFSAIQKSARAKGYEQALQWLLDAGLVHKSRNVSTPRLPLEGYCDNSSFKLFLLDVGLLGKMMNLSGSTILEGNKLFTEFKGALTENFVAQELVAHLEQPLYYWTSLGTAELDFLIQLDEHIFPLEVKAGTDNRKKSLRVYAEKYHPQAICRVSLLGLKRDGGIWNIPLYAMSVLVRLLRENSAGFSH